MQNGPDFFIPGASKSGTTSLHYYLSEHDDIFLPEEKELRFFDVNSNYSNGKNYYESMFKNGGKNKVIGEVSPAYFYKGTVYDGTSHKDYTWSPDDDAPTRIYNAYNDIKIITLRNPALRAYSQYWKNYRQGRERASSFKKAIQEELDGKRNHKVDPFCWVYRNKYSNHIGHWLDLFERKQIMFIIFEKWIDSSNETLNRISDILGVKQKDSWKRSDTPKNTGGVPKVVTFNQIYQKYIQGTPLAQLLQKSRVTYILDSLNTKRGYPDMSDDTKRLMSDIFEKEIAKTEELTGINLEIWRDDLITSN